MPAAFKAMIGLEQVWIMLELTIRVIESTALLTVTSRQEALSVLTTCDKKIMRGRISTLVIIMALMIEMIVVSIVMLADPAID